MASIGNILKVIGSIRAISIEPLMPGITPTRMPSQVPRNVRNSCQGVEQIEQCLGKVHALVRD